MKAFTRRNLLKTGLLAPAAAAAQGMKPLEAAIGATSETAGPLSTTNAAAPAELAGGQRDRMLLDFGWRFHLGNANDPEKDFGFGSGRSGNFQKTGDFLPAGSMGFDDSEWKPVDLPHDWAIELEFKNDPALMSKGFYPLGRNYPETSVGWYRRVFELAAADDGKRITLEFDGAYRETLVVFNGFYIGRHSGGYDPFSFDVTDFANPGGRNVLLVRVDATSSDGWFYEGAGHLSPRLAGQDPPGARKEVGNVCQSRSSSQALPLFPSGLKLENTATWPQARASSPLCSIPTARQSARHGHRRMSPVGESSVPAADTGEAAAAVVA